MIRATKTTSSATPPGLRARARVERRDGIILAARRILLDEGLEALTMHRVARDLGCAVGGLYRHYESRQALVGALVAEALLDAGGRVVRAVGGDAAAPAGDPAGPSSRRPSPRGKPAAEAALDALWRAVRALVDLAREAPERLRLIHFMLTDPRILVPGPERAGLVGAFAGALDDLGGLVDIAAARPALPGAPRARAIGLFGAVMGLLSLGKLARTDPSLLDHEATVGATVAALLAGFGADAAAVDAARRRSFERAAARPRARARKGGTPRS